jgi:hypothetical protein
MSFAILRSSRVDQRAFRRAMLAIVFAGGVAGVV